MMGRIYFFIPDRSQLISELRLPVVVPRCSAPLRCVARCVVPRRLRRPEAATVEPSEARPGRRDLSKIRRLQVDAGPRGPSRGTGEPQQGTTTGDRNGATDDKKRNATFMNFKAIRGEKTSSFNLNI